MLAVPAAPFDSPEYSFEYKWDGIRALAAVETAGWRLWGRKQADYTARYPELDVLRRLPAGTLVDGEMVACAADGRPDLPALLRRHALTDPWRGTCCSMCSITRAIAWCRSRWRSGAMCWRSCAPAGALPRGGRSSPGRGGPVWRATFFRIESRAPGTNLKSPPHC
jgi:hypothetical protein